MELSGGSAPSPPGASVRSRGKMMSAGTATGAKKRKNGSVGDGAVESASGVSRPVKKRKVENGEETKAKKTKSKATAEEECEAKKQPAAKSKSSSKGKGKEKASQDVDVDMDVTEDVQASSSSKPKQRRKPKAVREEDGDEETPAAPSTSKTASSSSKTAPPKPKTTSRKRKAPTTSTEPSDPEPFDDEMTGMLIEVLATSRASSLAVSVLCKSVLQAHPYLKDGAEPAGDSNEENGAFQGEGQEGTSKDAGAHPDGGLAEAGKQSCPYPYLKNRKSDKAWKGVVQRVLAAGSVEGGGSGVFGKVDSSGKDDSDRPLESQWFYVPECDADQDRAMLLRSLMPRPAKRSETKKYKQYYWRPLDKISRWDREDDL
ncbi:hypothetical protein BKA70DRAFT_411802 [Coprinopsis sp. MPI-PUGE-AT-0042]|nr:hypothetical protein BKA70DRAFT_411802 [Coprinopsis sp. MPI-PUGE-AT-0042]